jgi:hypothetical protein
MRRLLPLVAIVALLAGATLEAMDARLVEIRAIGPTVRATVDLRDVFSQKFREILAAGGALHVRIQMELWEDRPVWDRLVQPAIVTVFRIVRDPATSQIAVSDAVGLVQTWAAPPDPMSLRVDVAPASAVADDARYYLRAVATVGTIAEKDIAHAGDAVFGQDDGSVSLGRMGRMIFNAVLQATDYLQSVTAEAGSGKLTGRQVKSPPR